MSSRGWLLWWLCAALIISTARAYWVPHQGEAWQWQLNNAQTGQAMFIENVTVYDVDLFESTSATVENLHNHKAHVICYMSAGTYEAWRPDASSFPPATLGVRLHG